MNKFPKLIDKKWKRYSKIEKVFIIYLFVLLILEFILPIIKIEGYSFALINTSFILTSLILLLTIIFIIIWNISFTFKSFIKSVFGFEQNDAILNFGVLFLHASILILIKDMIGLLSFSRSSDYYTLDYGFYILAILIVLGLIWNLFLAINISIYSKKKSNYSKIVSASIEEENSSEKNIKSLFE